MKYARQITENNAEVKFEYVYKFKSNEELHELFNEFDWEIPELHNQIWMDGQ